MIDSSANKAPHVELETLLTTALSKASGALQKQNVDDVRQYISHGEYGVGWELLWHLVKEERLDVSVELIETGRRMGFDVSPHS